MICEEEYVNIFEEYTKLNNNIKLLLRTKPPKCKSQYIVNDIINGLKFLRNSCAKGTDVQNYIAFTIQPDLCDVLPPILRIEEISCYDEACTMNKLAWQFVANLCVQNINVQAFIWNVFNSLLLDQIKHNMFSNTTNIQFMILYNMLLSKNIKSIENIIFDLVITVLTEIEKQHETTPSVEYFYLILEHFFTKTPEIVQLCKNVDDDKCNLIYKQVLYYIEDENHFPILSNLLYNISTEFKRKSDRIINAVTSEQESNVNKAKEVYILLEIITLVSGSEKYKEIFKTDHALFINIGTLLKQLVLIGKESQNFFTPLQDLEMVAPSSHVQDRSFEHQISYKFKTMLIRTLANLSYKNPINQQYAREADILLAICDSTNLDARNPLIKEWCILAIRNLCEKCPENQQIIANFNKIGNASNSILSEFNIESGSLRIQRDQNR